MSAPSDESAAAGAERAGDRYRTQDLPRLYAYEPASGKWCSPPPILFLSDRPSCLTCGGFVAWCGEPTRTEEGWTYCVRCRCGEDELTSAFRLCQGGTLLWWRRRMGYDEAPSQEEESVKEQTDAPEPGSEELLDEHAPEGVKLVHPEAADAAEDPAAVDDRGPLFIPPVQDFDVSVLWTPDYNAHVMTDEEFGHLGDSLEGFGLVEDLVVNVHTDRYGCVVGGNKRLALARRKGQKVLPGKCVELEQDRERELNARLNANHGRFDHELMAEVGYTPEELERWGFAAEDREAFERASRELEEALRRDQGDGEGGGGAGSNGPEPPQEFPRLDPDKKTTHTCPRCSYEWNE